MLKLRTALWSLIVLGALAGVYGAALRYRVEAANRRVEITLDMTELQRIAASEGIPTAQVLERFRQCGALSVALNEDTLASLEETHRIEVVPSSKPGVTYLMTHQKTFPRILEALQKRARFRLEPDSPNAQLRVPPGTDESSVQDTGMEIYQPFPVIRSLGMGLDPNVIAAAHNADLQVVGRIENTPNISEAGIDWLLAQLKRQGVKTVIFSGDDVLGYEGQLKTTAAALAKHGLQVGAVEFLKVKGDGALYRTASPHVVRVHTISATEMAASNPADNIQRFSLAARERNIRLLFVRLFLDKTNPLEENVRYVQRLTSTLRRTGLTLGPAHSYPDFSLPIWARALIGLGLGAALLLMLEEVSNALETPRHPLAIVALATGALLVLLALFAPKLAAVAAAIVYAAWGVLQEGLLSKVTGETNLVRGAFLRLAYIVGITSLGIIAVVGLLSAQAFVVKTDVFVGIKAALYIPLFLAALVWVGELHAPSPSQLVERIRQRLKQALALVHEPIRLWQIGAAVLGLVVLAMLWLRSGNEGTAVVSGLELRFRDLLDATLPVRPRFKALLFSSLVTGIYLCLCGHRRWGVPLYLLGVISVTDYLNTFCHLHVPLLVSVLRDTLGLVLGLGLGLAFILLLKRYGKLG